MFSKYLPSIWINLAECNCSHSCPFEVKGESSYACETIKNIQTELQILFVPHSTNAKKPLLKIQNWNSKGA